MIQYPQTIGSILSAVITGWSAFADHDRC
jgi:hypothetical protein